MNKLFMEANNIKQAFVPVDLNAGANTGARISVKTGEKVAIVIAMGDSTAAVVTIDLDQHDAASAGNSKALAIANPYYHKKAAATSFTKVDVDVAADTYDLAAIFASDEGVVVFEVLAEDLDVNNGFAWLSVNLLDTTAAKVGAALYIVGDAKVEPAYATVL